MPDLVAVPTHVVSTRVVLLRASHHVYVEPSQVRSPQEKVVRHRTQKLKTISVVLVEMFVDDHVEERNSQRRPETAIHQPLVLLMARFVDPLEQADHKANCGDQEGDCQVEDGHFELTVHSVVDRREGTPGNEQIDACIVEPIGDGVCFWIEREILLDIG